ncbi:unnamed protein product [Caenorhabditis bovis]|uniref:Major sperm protein n=1 Tax=Caenorhabditis bovis TaxID=2654633 RepID=A0A8S1ETB8_9PELO|nr:unnamed protein product [Caenorhabditis bovis]
MPLPNKAGEPEFKLKVEPADKLVFKYKLGEECTIDMKITNPLKERNSFKVKCTDNDIFRVRPPLGFVKGGESAVVKITLKAKTAPDPTRHFFAIYHLKYTDMKSTARAVWTSETKPDGVIRLQAVLEDVNAEKKEETDKKEDDKKEDKKDDKKEEKDDKKDEKKDEKKEDKKEDDEKKK